MALLSSFPIIKPSLLLDFANVKALDPRITFTRTTTATYYDGKTTAKAEENLVQYSQEFDNAYFTKLRSTVSANAANAPDGTATADALTQASGQTVAGAVYPAATIAYSASTYILSVFAKPNGKDFIRLAMVDGGSTFRECYFDVNNGTVGTANNGAVGTITASADGYYRCSIAYTFSSGSTMSTRIFLADTDNSSVVVDSGGVYLWGAQVEQRSAVTAYTPTTTQAITNYIPVLQTAASGVARFDHNPTTGESLGLLVEEQRTNLCLRSEDFSTNWTTTNASVTTNTIIAPDGTLSGDTLTDDATSGQHQVSQTISVTSGTSYTLSCFVKEGTNQYARLSLGGAAMTFAAATFDLDAGTVLSGTATITPVGNGWYRISTTSAASSTGNGSFAIGLTNAGGTTYSGTGSTIYLWGAQLEAGAFPTSYIATTSASVTRNADAASMTGTNFSSWYRADEGTLYGDALFQDLTSGRLIAGISGATNVNRITIGLATLYNGAVVAGNAVQASLSSGTKTANSKIALAYKTNDFAFSGNAETVATDTSGILPVVDRIFIGSRVDANLATFANGTIKKIAYYPSRLSNAQLQALTTV